MPMRSFLKSDEARKLLSGKPFAVFVVCRQFWRENLEAVRELAEQQGGRYVDEIHFTYPGDKLRSMLSLTSYLGSGEYRERYLGIRIPPTNVQPEQLEQTRTFAGTPGGSVVRYRGSRDEDHLVRSSVYMPRSFDVSVESPASVEQVHAAFSGEEYWLARIANLSGSTTLESLIVDDDQTVRVTTTQDLGRDLLPGIVAKFYRRDLKVRHTETWRPSGDQFRGEISVAVSGAPGSGSAPRRSRPRRTVHC